MAQYKWVKLYHTSGGRRYFRDATTGKVAPCDQSGPRPHQTDDAFQHGGVLWLDTTKPLKAYGWSKYTRVPLGSYNSYASAPLIDDKGKSHSMMVEVTEMLWLAVNFGMIIGGVGHGLVQVSPAVVVTPGEWGTERTDPDCCYCGV
jgi:hypothetical protein